MPIKPDITRQTEHYREATRGQLYLSHVRIRCYCGKMITSRQRNQQGACDACYKQSKQAVEAA